MDTTLLAVLLAAFAHCAGYKLASRQADCDRNNWPYYKEVRCSDPKSKVFDSLCTSAAVLQNSYELQHGSAAAACKLWHAAGRQISLSMPSVKAPNSMLGPFTCIM